MPSPNFLQDLARFGPAAPGPPVTRAAATAYCQRLAAEHYENFTVVSWLLPRRLRPHFCHVYAYCRWADDLADEAPVAERAELLDWWEEQLADCYRGTARHPVFIALSETIAEFSLPQQPLADLLVAFRADQTVTRYETFADLLEYCRCSANPVGRLVLGLGRCLTPENAGWSDCICTGLQLANFWQDVAADWDRGRIYLPQESLRRYGYDETMFAARACTPSFRKLLSEEVARAEDWLRQGEPLIRQLPRDLRFDVALFQRGGLAILEKIRQVDFDVWRRRPALSRGEKLWLALRTWWRPSGNGQP